jgi:hypothetical protein
VEFGSEAFFTAVKTAFSTVSIFKNTGSALKQASLNVKGAVENLVADAEGLATAVETAPLTAPVTMPSKEELALLEKAGQEAGKEYIQNAAKEASDEKKRADAVETVKEVEAVKEGAVKEGAVKEVGTVKEGTNVVDTNVVDTNVVKEGEAAGDVKGGRANIRRRIKRVTRRLQNTLNSFRNNKSRKIIDKKIKNMRKRN